MNEQQDNKGKIVIVSGPSGVGKSTICKNLTELLKNAYLSVSLTTRPKGPNEIDGQDYWFISEKDFQQRINNGQMLEYAEVFGNLYGTPKDKTEEALQAGKIVILEIDVQGAKQVKVTYHDVLMIFILPPSQKDLARRINNRGREAEETAELRLGGADAEIAAAWQHYQHMVINDDLEQAVREVADIIKQNMEKTQ